MSAARRLPARRRDLSELTGYHSPQAEVEVRLNTNESPFPPPETWRREFLEELGRAELHRYPDRSATALREAVASFHGVGPEEVYCANGSNEVLQSLLLAYGGPGRSVACFEPTYALHSHIAAITATAVRAGPRRSDFSLDPEVVETVVDDAGPTVVFLCSPNNPTGLVEDQGLVCQVLSVASGLVVVDEAYGQFAPRSALELGQGARERGLVVVRTFSKIWSMAAVRLGYLVAAPEVVEACQAVTLPYHLSTTTQVAGRLALRHVEEMEKRVAAIVAERERLVHALGSLPVTTWPSQANFVLFRPHERPASEVWDDLVARSVLVRDCSSWPALEGCLRVTVGTPEENERFVEALAGSLT